MERININTNLLHLFPSYAASHNNKPANQFIYTCRCGRTEFKRERRNWLLRKAVDGYTMENKKRKKATEYSEEEKKKSNNIRKNEEFKWANRLRHHHHRHHRLRCSFCIHGKALATHLFPNRLFQKSAASDFVMRNWSPANIPFGKMAFNSLSICEKTRLSFVRFRL